MRSKTDVDPKGIRILRVVSDRCRTYDRTTLAHVGHVSFVYIMVNPAVLSHSCTFPWLRM